MVVLALETVTRAGSVAVLRDGVLRGREGDPARTHGERLPGEIVDLLASEGLGLRDVDLFAIVAGPGSFTGLRVGMATVQGLALATGRQVVALPTLEVMVSAWRRGGAAPAPAVAACLDGQRGDVFYAVYRLADVEGAPAGAWPALVTPSVGRPGDLAATIGARVLERPLVAIGSGAERYRTALAGVAGLRVEPYGVPLASAAARLAGESAASAVSPHALRPIYIRRPDAVIARERQRRAAGGEAAPVGEFAVQRARGPEDLAAVEALQRSAFAEPWGAGAFAREAANGAVARIYVMRAASGEVVAYCACWLVVDELHINSLAVAERWRRLGLATRLLDAVSREAQAEGATSATLEVRESNRAGRALYERLGFRVEGVRRDYYQTPREDAIVLWNRDLRERA
jgi:tRNA threonylcarbamoyl adenosine modification protein YeaZ/ribosomal-protein-alanine acetyltransferase